MVARTATHRKRRWQRGRVRTIGLLGGMSWESSAEYYRVVDEGCYPTTRLHALAAVEAALAP